MASFALGPNWARASWTFITSTDSSSRCFRASISTGIASVVEGVDVGDGLGGIEADAGRVGGQGATERRDGLLGLGAEVRKSKVHPIAAVVADQLRHGGNADPVQGAARSRKCRLLDRARYSRRWPRAQPRGRSALPQSRPDFRSSGPGSLGNPALVVAIGARISAGTAAPGRRADLPEGLGRAAGAMIPVQGLQSALTSSGTDAAPIRTSACFGPV